MASNSRSIARAALRLIFLTENHVAVKITNATNENQKRARLTSAMDRPCLSDRRKKMTRGEAMITRANVGPRLGRRPNSPPPTQYNNPSRLPSNCLRYGLSATDNGVYLWSGPIEPF